MLFHIEPAKVFKILKDDKNSLLLDVRTIEEFSFAGFVDLSLLKQKKEEFSKQLLMLPWKLYPQMDYNPEFRPILEKYLNKNFTKILEVKMFFLCKTGGRSREAANYFLNLGYENCYNVIGGFEGELNNQYQRGKINGWKAANLPWRQI
jgi:rhodanese-related sulfurtransferase